MKAINITKYSPWTHHFYITFWDVNSYVSPEDILKGSYTIESSVFTKINEINGESHIKGDDEKELIKKAKIMLQNHYLMYANIIIVFVEGKYSESRTNYINNLE